MTVPARVIERIVHTASNAVAYLVGVREDRDSRRRQAITVSVMRITF